MAGFGESLLRERKLRGISLEEIAAATRIGQHFLVALENERFQDLPGGIFNRSFVRAYAAYLGLNEAEIVQEYVRVSGDRGELPMPNPPARIRRRRLRLQTTQVVWAAVVVLLAAAGLAGLKMWWARPASAPPARAAHAVPPRRTIPSTTAATVAPPPEIPGVGALLIEIRAVGETAWISAVADGKPVLEATLSAGDIRSFRAQTEFDLVTGNAAATTVAINGHSQPALGTQGQVVHFHYPPQVDSPK